MTKQDYKELGLKIIKGCQLAFEKLLAQEKLRDGELVFSEDDGTIVHVKAREYEAYMEKKAQKKLEK